MLRLPVSTIGLVALLAGCGDPNAGRLFADIQYATRCDIERGCSGRVDHDICGFNGGDPCDGVAGTAVLSCSVEESGSTRTINFSATLEDSDFNIRISRLTVPVGGGSATGGDCEVTVTEGANTYAGSCGGSTASDAQPCQITNVTFMDVMGNPELEGNVFCQHLANRATPSLKIEVTAPGAGVDPAARPGRFRIANCAGLTL